MTSYLGMVAPAASHAWIKAEPADARSQYQQNYTRRINGPWGTVTSLPSTVRVMSAFRAGLDVNVLRAREYIVNWWRIANGNGGETYPVGSSRTRKQPYRGARWSRA